MDKGTAQAVKEIERTRERLGSDLQELASRLPEPRRVARRAAGVAIGGGAGGTAFWLLVRRLRRQRQTSKVEQAKKVVLNVVPDEWTKRIGKELEDGRWKSWAAGFGAAWVLIRLSELRQMRAMRRDIAVQ